MGPAAKTRNGFRSRAATSRRRVSIRSPRIISRTSPTLDQSNDETDRLGRPSRRVGCPRGVFLGTLVWAAAPASEPVRVVKSGTTFTLYGVALASPTAGWVVGSGGTILATRS